MVVVANTLCSEENCGMVVLRGVQHARKSVMAGKDAECCSEAMTDRVMSEPCIACKAANLQSQFLVRPNG